MPRHCLFISCPPEMEAVIRAKAEGPPRRPLAWVVTEIIEREFAAELRAERAKARPVTTRKHRRNGA